MRVAPLSVALTAVLGGCCLDIGGELASTSVAASSSGTASGSSTGASSTSAGGVSSTGTSSGGVSSSTAAGSSTGVSSGSSTGASSSGASSTGSTTGTVDAGTTIWLSGGLAFDPATLAFNSTCFGGDAVNSAALVDGQGDLWSTLGPYRLYMWTPGELQQGCRDQPLSHGLGLDLSALAFDSSGNLWASTTGSVPFLAQADGGLPQIVGFAAHDLQSPSGAFAPRWALSGDCGSPASLCTGALGLAFDSSGYLWVANQSSLVAFAPDTLTAAIVSDAGIYGVVSSALADLVLLGSTADRFNSLAFDADGNLWASVDVAPTSFEIRELSKAQLGNLSQNAQPAPIFIVTETGAQQREVFGGWGPLAFDADGNLWAASQPRPPPVPLNLLPPEIYSLFRFSPESLADGGVPDVTIEVFGNNPVASVAVSPIPAGLPIRP